jgi:COP9 signalosome complex subunit 1
MVKELIRVSHVELGDHLYQCGDLESATKNYTKSRENATNHTHSTTAYLSILKCGLAAHRWKQVDACANKLMHGDVTCDGETGGYMRFSQGLFYLMNCEYRMAALTFLDIPFAEGDVIRDVVSVRDITAYAGLCALATFDRSMLKRRFLDQPTFKPYLDSAPEIRETIRAFYDSNYKRCLHLLAVMKNDVLLDIYMLSHVHNVYHLIRQNCIVQYFIPFVSADMSSMASTLDMTVEELELEVIHLIAMTRLEARIDSEKKVLHARSVNQRALAFSKTLEMCDQYIVHARGLLIRMAMANKNLVVR